MVTALFGLPWAAPFRRHLSVIKRDWYFIAEEPASAPHLAHPEGCAAPRIVLDTVPRVSRSCVTTLQCMLKPESTPPPPLGGKLQRAASTGAGG